MAERAPRATRTRPSPAAARAPADRIATAERIAAVERFPDDNPNPVMRVGADGRLDYANPASTPIVQAVGATVGEPLPAEFAARLDAAAAARESIEVVAANRTYAIRPVRIEDLAFTNLYGTDVTAERAIVKFPDQNPNPVLRIDRDGRLVYANPAAAGLIDGFGVAVGGSLPAELRERLLAVVRTGVRHQVDARSSGRTYALLPVDVPEFGFINVYGTDVTAELEREHLARENERLLLNILPEPIARRLRDGEPLIADRFEDVTLLFADIVGFTQLSSTMSPSELVAVLNEVFTVFDGLVDGYGLEKVKTIGDAYMVVGGMTDIAIANATGSSADHARRMASLALDLGAQVGSIDAAARLGIAFRIGIHCGPVVAGVIGTRKFIYDVWGDTVNLASRMESLGAPGRIQVTQAVRDRLADEFDFESRGLMDVKGKGRMETWFLTGRAGLDLRPTPAAPGLPAI